MTVLTPYCVSTSITHFSLQFCVQYCIDVEAVVVEIKIQFNSIQFNITQQGRTQVLRKGRSNIFDVAKYIGVLEVGGGRGWCMHVNPPSFIQRLRHFGD